MKVSIFLWIIYSGVIISGIAFLVYICSKYKTSLKCSLGRKKIEICPMDKDKSQKK